MATVRKTFPPSGNPEIRIITDDWGNASKQDILWILESVAELLFSLVDSEHYPTILVGRSSDGPKTLFNRGKQGEYLIKLNALDRFWCQYAFQFSHEIGHIICGFKDGDSSNLWFEETICEVASLLVLQRMEESWTKRSPYEHWKDYGGQFSKYAKDRIRQNPYSIDESMAEWFLRNRNSLKESPTNRARNLATAIILLPLFAEDANSWNACAYLNKRKTKKARSFETYLSDWRMECPKGSQKFFVEKIAEAFAIMLPPAL